MKRIEVNVVTGERREIDLTPTEIAEGEARKAAEQVGLYKRLRAQAYPPIGDQLDALFHAGIFPAEMAAKLAEVKARFPK